MLLTSPVEFDGEPAGSAPLTWGQRNMRRSISENPPGHFNLSRVINPPKRTPLDPAGATRLVRALLGRHESLRTVYADGEQRVVGSGRLEPAQVDAGGDPDLAAEQLRSRLAGPAFADATELPLRVGLVTDAGRVQRVVLVVSHLSADATSMDIIERELRLLALRGTVRSSAGLQPRELAAREQRRGRTAGAAVAHWEDLFRRMPPSMFDVEGRPYEPPCQRFRLTSGALLSAVQLVAGALRVSTATVLLAATAVNVARWTGHRTVTIGILVGNRFQAGHQDMVATLAQQGLFGLDLPGPVESGPRALADLVPPVHQAAMRAYQRAYYDPDELWPRLDRVRADRGAWVDPYCCVNDARTASDLAAGADPATLRAAAAAAGPATLEALPPLPRMHCRFCLLASDGPGAITLRLTADTRYLPPAEIQRFLRETEQLVLDTAQQDL